MTLTTLGELPAFVPSTNTAPQGVERIASRPMASGLVTDSVEAVVVGVGVVEVLPGGAVAFVERVGKGHRCEGPGAGSWEPDNEVLTEARGLLALAAVAVMFDAGGGADGEALGLGCSVVVSPRSR